MNYSLIILQQTDLNPCSMFIEFGENGAKSVGSINKKTWEFSDDFDIVFFMN